LERHDAQIVHTVEGSGGRIVKTTGDGALATFPSVNSALRAARGIHHSVGQDGLQLRVGVHVGDVERQTDDIAGIAVHIAARVMALATAGETLVTASAVIAANGSNHHFESVGDHALRGIAGAWELFRLVP
jgi:class 3 adenylate cyclase